MDFTFSLKTATKKSGVDTKFRSASRLGSLRKRGNHSNPALIQNCEGLITVPA